VTPANIDPSLVVSKALSLSQGTIASGANRYDADTIAKYEFQTGSGYTAYDTSGIDPAADLTITAMCSGPAAGASMWVPGQGAGQHVGQCEDLQLDPGDREFSVEAWVAPALVAVDKSYMVSYSGGDTLRNSRWVKPTKTTISCCAARSPISRHDAAQDSGCGDAAPGFLAACGAHLRSRERTPDLRQRRECERSRPQKGGTISNWDNTFALVLGNEVSGDRSWQGLIKFVAIHSRAMSATQVMQNFTPAWVSASTCCSTSRP